MTILTYCLIYNIIINQQALYHSCEGKSNL